eukprot:2136432-Rhodomonas_salina.1
MSEEAVDGGGERDGQGEMEQVEGGNEVLGRVQVKGKGYTMSGNGEQIAVRTAGVHGKGCP